MKDLYVFDFDGTLYKGDSMLDFAKFSNRKRYYFSFLFLLPALVNYKLGFLSPAKMKEKFLTYHFKGKSKSDLIRLGNSFFTQHQGKIYSSARKFLQELDQSNTDCYIVSGSCAEWLLPFAKSLGVNLRSSHLCYENDIFTGKLNGENCVGKEKTKQIRQVLEENTYREVFVYGNSTEDFDMKTIATNYFHLYFST